MKLDNRTKYDTRTLRKLLIAVFRAQSDTFQIRIRQWKHVQVRISYSRPGTQLEWLPGHYENLGMHEDAAKAREHAEHRRRRHVSGCAYIAGRWAELRVPPVDVATDYLAAVWLHELWHIAGSNHEGFPAAVMHCHVAPLAWVNDQFGAALHETPPKKVVRDLVAERRLRLEKRLAGWQSRFKRAQKAVTKLNRQLRYYDRREKLAAGKAAP